jgi:hypothetical protein
MKSIWKDMLLNAEELVKISGTYLKKYPTDSDWKKIHSNNKKHLANVKASYKIYNNE